MSRNKKTNQRELREAAIAAGEIIVIDDWRKSFVEMEDPCTKSDILRAVLRRKPSTDEIAECASLMECLPKHLQSYIAADIICNPRTSRETYERVKDNEGLLTVTTSTNIRRMRLRHSTR